MKNSSFAILTLILVLSFGCQNHEKQVSKKTLSKSEITGIYNIGGFGIKPGVTMDTLRENGLLHFGNTPFNFQQNDSVRLSKECAELFFQDSVFHYEITKDLIIFTSGNKRFEMKYVKDGGTIRIDIENEYLTRIDLSHLQNN